MSNNQIIAIHGDGFNLSIHPEAETKKAEAIALSKPIIQVRDSKSKDQGVAVVANIKALTRACEKARKDTKEPILELGKTIDRLARDYSAALAEEAERVERLIASYVAEEARKVEEARRKQREEQEALERAKREQERLEREAEEAIRRAEAAKTRAAREKAEKEAQEAARAAAAQSDKVAEAQINAAEAEQVVVDTRADDKAAGAAVRPTFDIEITDIAALYRARPDCVKLEPRLRELRTLVESGLHEIPGVKITETTKVSVRAGTNTLNLK